MDYKIQKAILHIMGNNGIPPVYSQKELDLTEATVSDFIVMHVKKIYYDDSSKKGIFNRNAFILSELNNLQTSFTDTSIVIADHLYNIMKTHCEIPSADLLIVLMLIDEIPYIAIIKFNYKEGYTHYVDYDEDGTNNKIIVHKVLFASEGQKNDEGVLVNLNDYSLFLVEKPYRIDGEHKFYFSEMFLECKTDLSRKESVKVISEVARDITKQYYNDNFQKISDVKSAIYDNIEIEGSINIDTIAETCFEDNHAVQEEYIQKLRQAGVANTIEFSGDSPERKFSKQKIKTDNGIEITMPVDVYKNKDAVEFNNNADGTISIILKNINRITSK
ncbi:nucleoid-associated protein [Sporomusa sp. GT1]|uniref:nucleoid-associated protein n=1 Tax=Sporomusa sp. GT1 TaxID=1534747 RepID=UPI0016634631|nr:nucleoid-associated protein [Sporomusa sp. GT1]